jgi:peptidoglycan/LPS O-acetylase OafA/YrhL
LDIKKTQRIQWLDVLRGVAILLVVLFHFTARYAQKYPYNSFNDQIFLRIQFGWIGVHLFFMISGFIIYLTIQKKKGFWDFLVARLSRLMPPYWAAILVIIILEYPYMAVFNTPSRNNLVYTLFNIAMIPDLFDIPFLDGAFWSLYVEIKFYLFFAVLWQVLDMRKKRNFYFTYFIILFAALVHNYVHRIPLGDNFNYFLIFWTGIAACKALKENLAVWEYSLITLLTAASTLGYYTKGFELLFSIPVFAVLFITSETLFNRYPYAGRLFSPLAFCGRVSYSFYLTHQPVGYIMLGLLAGLAVNYNIAVLLSVAVCIMVSLAGFAFVEQMDKPIAKYITDRFFPGKSKVGVYT